MIASFLTSQITRRFALGRPVGMVLGGVGVGLLTLLALVVLRLAPSLDEPSPPAPAVPLEVVASPSPPQPLVTESLEEPEPSEPEEVEPLPEWNLPTDLEMMEPVAEVPDLPPTPSPVAQNKPAPTASKAKRSSRAKKGSSPRARKPQRSQAKAKAKPKASRGPVPVSALDGIPKLRRSGKGSFPSSLRRRGITRGRVLLEVSISPSGRVAVRRVISASHPELIPVARRIAQGSRYTTPRRGGQPVTAILRLPITIKQ